MISLQDVQEAIKEVEAMPDTYSKAEKLATFYTLRDALQPEPYRAAPVEKISYVSESDFAQAVAGRDPEEVMPIIDELMDTISIINPRLYNGVMDRLK